MPSPGKSGSVFFLSDDDRFLIKTVSHEEMLLLLKLIPAYYRHCADNPTTLLTRFFGVHRVKPLGSQSKAGLPSCLPALKQPGRSSAEPASEAQLTARPALCFRADCLFTLFKGFLGRRCVEPLASQSEAWDLA